MPRRDAPRVDCLRMTETPNPIHERARIRADAEFRKQAEVHYRIERRNWRRQATIMKAQLTAARRLNCVTGVAAIVAFVALIATIAFTIYQFRQSTAALHLDQRAWAATGDWHYDKVNSPTIVSVDIRNSGKTFALHASAWLTHALELTKIPNTDDQIMTENSGILVPGASFNISLADSPLSQGEVYALEQGDPLYFFGTVWYYDIFGPPEHWTQYCERLKLKKVDEKTYTPIWSPCPNGLHNKTDDEPERLTGGSIGNASSSPPLLKGR